MRCFTWGFRLQYIGFELIAELLSDRIKWSRSPTQNSSQKSWVQTIIHNKPGVIKLSSFWRTSIWNVNCFFSFNPLTVAVGPIQMVIVMMFILLWKHPKWHVFIDLYHIQLHFFKTLPYFLYASCYSYYKIYIWMRLRDQQSVVHSLADMVSSAFCRQLVLSQSCVSDILRTNRVGYAKLEISTPNNNYVGTLLLYISMFRNRHRFVLWFIVKIFRLCTN